MGLFKEKPRPPEPEIPKIPEPEIPKIRTATVRLDGDITAKTYECHLYECDHNWLILTKIIGYKWSGSLIGWEDDTETVVMFQSWQVLSCEYTSTV